MSYRLGVDVGGTFTDVLLVEEASGSTWRAKTASTPSDQAVGVLNGIGKVCAEAGIELSARSRRCCTAPRSPPTRSSRARAPPSAWSRRRASARCCRSRAPTCPAGWPAGSSGPSPSRWPRWRTPSRWTSGSPATARSIRELDEDDVRAQLGKLTPVIARAGGIQALAVSLINSFADPAHEKRIARDRRRGAARRAGVAVLGRAARDARVRAHAHHGRQRLRPAAGEALRARRCRPSCTRAACTGELAILRSDGGLQSAAHAAIAAPVTMLLSGPAGGVTGAVWVAEQCGYRDLITFDMGGTSTDVALVQDLTPRIGRETKVGDLTVRASSVDVRTVGAGGGSIAHVPELTKALRVGPQSAGADPGPAAYGKGGTEPTVTDANVVLGYLPVVAGRRRDHPRRRGLPRSGRQGRRGHGAGAHPRRPRPRASSTSSTRTCSAACAWSPCSRASTRATSRSSRSAAPGRCTPTPSAS